MGLEIALGGGALAIIAVVVLFFILLRNSGARGDRAEAREAATKKELGDKINSLELGLTSTTADRDRLVEANGILETNQTELLKALAEHKQTLQRTEAELASVKATRDDLVRVLKDQPGALPAAIRGALDRLRAQMSEAGAASTAPAGEGDHGGETRSLHGPDDLEPPG